MDNDEMGEENRLDIFSLKYKALLLILGFQTRA